MMDPFSKLKEMKTLLIDDDELIRDSLSMFFESEGCQETVFSVKLESPTASIHESYICITNSMRAIATSIRIIRRLIPSLVLSE